MIGPQRKGVMFRLKDGHDELYIFRGWYFGVNQCENVPLVIVLHFLNFNVFPMLIKTINIKSVQFQYGVVITDNGLPWGVRCGIGKQRGRVVVIHGNKSWVSGSEGWGTTK